MGYRRLQGKITLINVLNLYVYLTMEDCEKTTFYHEILRRKNVNIYLT